MAASTADRGVPSAPAARAEQPPEPDRSAPRGDAVVACLQLSKVFKDFWLRDRAKAVNNLTFEIMPREVFGLLGPNGSGKSTTIKMILGLLHPTSGRLAVFGKDPTDVATKRRIGYLPEESYLYGFLNARETLDYYGKLFEIDHRTRQRRIDELLDMLGLAGAQFRPVREYSKGMQRRIGLAQALINDPDLLILDEPTTGLDPLGTRQVKDLIIELGRRGKTILLSSHLLSDVEECVDRLVILYGGQKRAEGTCDQLLVTQTRTTIETDAIDDATVADIDRLIRARSDGGKAILRVAKPRQTLEELFLDIVARAKAEQVNTSGATSGGETASFLKGDAAEGQALIDQLLKAPEPPAEDPAKADDQDGSAGTTGTGAAGANARAKKPDASVIDLLTKPADPAPTQTATAARPAALGAGNASPSASGGPAKPDVNRSMIDSLLGGAADAPEGRDGPGGAAR